MLIVANFDTPTFCTLIYRHLQQRRRFLSAIMSTEFIFSNSLHYFVKIKLHNNKNERRMKLFHCVYLYFSVFGWLIRTLRLRNQAFALDWHATSACWWCRATTGGLFGSRISCTQQARQRTSDSTTTCRHIRSRTLSERSHSSSTDTARQH